MKHILILASWFPEPNHPTKGIFVRRQAEAIALHHKVSLAYVRKSNLNEEEKVEWEHSGNLSICTVLSKGFGTLNTLWAYRQAERELLKRNGPFDRRLVEVVHPAGIYAWLGKLFLGKSFYISEHLDLFLREDLGLDQSRPFGRWLRGRIHRAAKGTTISSQALKVAFGKRGIPRLQILPNVIEVPDSEPDNWANPSGPKKFIHISSLRDHQKNIRGILAALKILQGAREDWEFHFLGSGTDIYQLKAESEAQGLGKQVTFLGFVSESEKVEALKTAIAHVMLSHYEGFSVSTAEAIAHGCPVIVSDCGGPGDFVRPNNGYLIDKDPEKLAQTLENHLDTYRDFDRQAMYHYIKDRYAPEAIAQAYDSFLDF